MCLGVTGFGVIGLGVIGLGVISKRNVLARDLSIIDFDFSWETPMLPIKGNLGEGNFLIEAGFEGNAAAVIHLIRGHSKGSRINIPIQLETRS